MQHIGGRPHNHRVFAQFLETRGKRFRTRLVRPVGKPDHHPVLQHQYIPAIGKARRGQVKHASEVAAQHWRNLCRFPEPALRPGPHHDGALREHKRRILDEHRVGVRVQSRQHLHRQSSLPQRLHIGDILRDHAAIVRCTDIDSPQPVHDPGAGCPYNGVGEMVDGFSWHGRVLIIRVRGRVTSTSPTREFVKIRLELQHKLQHWKYTALCSRVCPSNSVVFSR